MKKKTKRKISIRELLHSLGNDLNLITVGAGVTAMFVEKCLGRKKGASKNLSKKLLKISQNLKSIENDAEQAGSKLRAIHRRLYKVKKQDIPKPKSGEKLWSLGMDYIKS